MHQPLESGAHELGKQELRSLVAQVTKAVAERLRVQNPVSAESSALCSVQGSEPVAGMTSPLGSCSRVGSSKPGSIDLLNSANYPESL